MEEIGDEESGEEGVEDEKEDEDEGEELPPDTFSHFTFQVPSEDWQALLDGAVPCRSGSNAGKGCYLKGGWRSLLVEPVEEHVPFCHFDRKKLSTPFVRLVGAGLYVSLYLDCKKETSDGQKCTVRYNVYRAEPFDPQAEVVEFSVLLVDGNPETSHLDPQSGKPLYHRRRIMGSLRKKLKAQFASSNKTLKQIVQDMSLEAESAGSLSTGDLTMAPTRSAITHMVKEERRKSQLHENPVYAELIWHPLGIIMFSEKSIRLVHRIFSHESVVYCDASGALVSDVGSKKVFLYVLLVEGLEDPTMNISTPLLYFLSVDHKTERIRHALSLFLSSIQSRVG